MSVNKKSSVDILLPYWGDLELAKKTVESIIAQTNDNWRLLIFDDCYPSKAPQKYFESIDDSRVSYYRHPKNLGITKNFNYALAHAEAEFCMLIGCDDVLLPNYIELSLARMGGADFYQPPVQIIDAEGKDHFPLADRIKYLIAPSKPGIYKGEQLATSLCHGNWLYFPSILWRTSTIKKYLFNTQYSIVEDLDLELRMIIDGATLYLDKGRPTFQYRRFSDSLSSKERRRGGVRFNEEATVYKKFSLKFASIGWHRAKRAAAIRATSRIHEIMSLV